ncbi:hypothetical protein DIPPA_15145 [Diplonema papillatum]|nr:hypothetical protein DIPPA_15145 [Diplonema papillatum]
MLAALALSRVVCGWDRQFAMSEGEALQFAEKAAPGGVDFSRPRGGTPDGLVKELRACVERMPLYTNLASLATWETAWKENPCGFSTVHDYPGAMGAGPIAYVGDSTIADMLRQTLRNSTNQNGPLFRTGKTSSRPMNVEEYWYQPSSANASHATQIWWFGYFDIPTLVAHWHKVLEKNPTVIILSGGIHDLRELLDAPRSSYVMEHADEVYDHISNVTQDLLKVLHETTRPVDLVAGTSRRKPPPLVLWMETHTPKCGVGRWAKTRKGKRVAGKFVTAQRARAACPAFERMHGFYRTGLKEGLWRAGVPFVQTHDLIEKYDCKQFDGLHTGQDCNYRIADYLVNVKVLSDALNRRSPPAEEQHDVLAGKQPHVVHPLELFFPVALCAGPIMITLLLCRRLACGAQAKH